MEKHFATYEQSLALKELGFDESCFGYYVDKTGEDVTIYTVSQVQCSINSMSVHFNINNGYPSSQFSAPLKQQVFRWFREKYGYWSYNKEATKVTCRFYIEKFDEKFFNSGLFGSYEEAESACIDKLIEIMKNNLDK